MIREKWIEAFPFSLARVLTIGDKVQIGSLIQGSDNRMRVKSIVHLIQELMALLVSLGSLYWLGTRMRRRTLLMLVESVLSLLIPVHVEMYDEDGCY